MLTNIVAKWPGSTHDSFIYRHSNIGELLSDDNRRLDDGFLLGDSGYACSRSLMTPFLRPQTPAEHRYNASHKRTRSTIERCFGILKRRFPVLHAEIRMKPSRVCKIISACAVLHNLAIQRNEPLPTLDVNVRIREQPNNLYQGLETGRAVRNHIVNTYFA